MAIVYSYPQVAPELDDLLFGSRMDTHGNPSKSFLIEDIINLAKDYTFRPYKVYTALLTQSGASDINFIFGGQLTIGMTYLIVDTTVSANFTNVGAPNNNDGTYFVATGTTPDNWGGAQLSYNAGTPVATVLENTIGNIYWTYSTTGRYNANLTGAFVPSKTFVVLSSPNYAYTSTAGVCSSSVDIDFVQIYTLDDSFLQSNDQLYLNEIEIRVYN